MEFSCFFCDPTDVGNLISGSSAFSKSCLNIWKFLVRVLLKPSVMDFEHYIASMWASLIAQLVKNPPAMQETWIQSLGCDDLLEEDIAAHSSILAWSIAMDRGAWRAAVHGAAKSQTLLSD